MRILVTGGAGFIGAHLVGRLVTDGHDVLVIDNFTTGRVENLDGLGVQIFHRDVCSPQAFEGPAFRDTIDQVYHLACIASPKAYTAHPFLTLRTGTEGTFQALSYAAGVGARCVVSSTSETYGEPLEHPQREEMWSHVNAIGPRCCYDTGKVATEGWCTVFAHKRSADVRIARIFNTYGERMQPDDGRVVSNFIMQALRGDPLTVYGDGAQTRSLCYVSDMVNGLIKLMEAPQSPASMLPVNLGNPHEMNVLSIAQMIKALTNSKSNIEHHPLPSDDPTRRCPDISRAVNWLGWAPMVMTPVGIGRTIAWFSRGMVR